MKTTLLAGMMIIISIDDSQQEPAILSDIDW